jgi:D-alanine-D-alanine ligase
MRRKLIVAVLCGGPSNEYAVSLRSAEQIVRTLRSTYRTVRLVLPKDPKRIIGFLDKHLRGVDVAVMSALHGQWGEDGRIQAMLEALGVPYTGSGVLSSGLGMHKLLSYELARLAGLTVPPYIALHGIASVDAVHARIKDTVGYPCVVKPNASGSSIGVSIVRKSNELTIALKKAFSEDETVIVQSFISGHEVTCGVLGNTARTDLPAKGLSSRRRPARFEPPARQEVVSHGRSESGGWQAGLFALPPVLIRTPHGTFFDYHAKYESSKTQELCPAPLDGRTISLIEMIAMKAHALFRCDGLTRSDFILGKDKTLYFLEINTAPGMTAASLCPKEAKALGWSFGEFLEKIIELALLKR